MFKKNISHLVDNQLVDTIWCVKFELEYNVIHHFREELLSSQNIPNAML